MPRTNDWSLRDTLFDPLTRRLLQQAGLTPGMRVLDLGSGAGNVARLAAELVGPNGAVVGVENGPGRGRARPAADRRTGAANVEFRVGDVQTLDGVEDGFDAVGRPAGSDVPARPGRRAAPGRPRLRPGGLICLHEADLAYLPAGRRRRSGRRSTAGSWKRWRRRHRTSSMGPILVHRVPGRRAAGAGAAGRAFAAGGTDSPAWAWANVISATVPLMERHGVASGAEVDPPTLADRLLAETAPRRLCLGPPMFGAWATVAAA